MSNRGDQRKAILAVSVLSAVVLFCQLSRQAWSEVKELPSPSASPASAPDECLTTLRKIIAYVFSEKPDIMDDHAAQARWFTKDFQKSLHTRQENCSHELKAHPTDKIDFPSNETLARFWSPPTTYLILGSRRYETHAVVDLLYSWGKGSDYEGDSEVVSYVFNREDKSWRLNDIYTLQGKYTPATSLQQELQSACD